MLLHCAIELKLSFCQVTQAIYLFFHECFAIYSCLIQNCIVVFGKANVVMTKLKFSLTLFPDVLQQTRKVRSDKWINMTTHRRSQLCKLRTLREPLSIIEFVGHNTCRQYTDIKCKEKRHTVKISVRQWT